MNITAIVLAGGLGTRLRSVVSDVPKPMAPIGGRPFLAYLLDYWIAQGVNRFVLSVGYMHETIINFFGNRYRGVDIDYAIEVTPLGTGGGFLQATKKIASDEPFLLLNGDTYFAVDLKQFLQFFQAKDADWCFSLFRTKENGRYMGMDVSEDGRIVALKSGAAEQNRLANGGVYLVNPRALRNLEFASNEKISIEDDIFTAALAAGQRLFGVEFSGTFFDIGLPEDYHIGTAILTE